VKYSIPYLQFIYTSQEIKSTSFTSSFNPLQTKCRLFYLKTQFVPRSKHFSIRL